VATLTKAMGCEPRMQAMAKAAADSAVGKITELRKCIEELRARIAREEARCGMCEEASRTDCCAAARGSLRPGMVALPEDQVVLAVAL
jgi:hypothetical protein